MRLEPTLWRAEDQEIFQFAFQPSLDLFLILPTYRSQSVRFDCYIGDRKYDRIGDDNTMISANSLKFFAHILQIYRIEGNVS